MKILGRGKCQNRDSIRLLAFRLVQCHLVYTVSSWYWALNKASKRKLQVPQSKLVRAVLELDNGSPVSAHPAPITPC